MKIVEIPNQAKEINELLKQARDQDLLVRSADGSEFMLTVLDDFDVEVAATRRNEKLMALLDARAREEATISLEEVKNRLGL